MAIWLAVLFALFITMALVPLLRDIALRLQAVDMPNERKVHSRPMAKTGGLAMAVGALIPILIWLPAGMSSVPLLISCLMIIVFGFVDDLKDLNSRIKFFVQFLAALVVVVWGGLKITTLGGLLPAGLLLPDFVAIPLTLFVIVGVTNAINLADGLDGLAGGISLLSYICIAYLAFLSDRLDITLIAAAMAGAIFGFLRFNTYPASVFMGDAGSQLLGFLAIVLALELTQTGAPYSPVLPLLLLGFPILDTLTVMTERIAHGHSPFVADKNHFHHKLMRHGLSHAESVITIYMLQTCLMMAGFLLRFYSDWLLLLGYLMFSGLILVTFHRAQQKNWRFNEVSATRLHLRGRLSRWLSRDRAIKFSFRAVQLFFPAALVAISFMPKEIPGWLGGLSCVLLMLLLLRRDNAQSGHGLILRLAVYLVPPVLLYLGELVTDKGWSFSLSHLLFILLILLVVAVIRFSRRAGYRSTPLDYLVLFLALVVPNLNLFAVPDQRVGLMAAMLLVLFFTLEVLLEETRNNCRSAVAAVYLMTAIVVVRAIF